MVTSELTPIQKQEDRDKLIRLFNIFIPVSILLGALAGVLVGAVWNFAVTQLYTWGKKAV